MVLPVVQFSGEKGEVVNEEPGVVVLDHPPLVRQAVASVDAKSHFELGDGVRRRLRYRL